MNDHRYIADRNRNVEAIFNQVVDQSELDTGRMLDELCGGDTELRSNVQRLLSLNDERLGDFMNAPATTVSETSCIPGYKIIRQIGEGGMGSVFLAEQVNPRREVALKTLKSALASTEVRKRFEYEAQVLGQLQHPGIAQIYEAGSVTICNPAGLDVNQPYFAMELVDGCDLIEFASSQDLSIAERLQLVIEVCNAVQSAHLRGVVHRDLKPSNILVTKEGRIKILDFGVARLIDNEQTRSTVATQKGQLIGTLAYMSPEQMTGDSANVDTRSDVYSIGVLMYELLSKHRPYNIEGLSIPDAIQKIRHEPPFRISNYDQKLRGDIETIVEKSLEKDKSRRYQSAAELAADINRYINHRPIHSRRVSRAEKTWLWCRRHPLVAGLYVALATSIAIGMAGVVWQWQEAKTQAALAESKHQKSQENFEHARQAIDRLTETSRELSSVPGTDEIREQALREVLAFYLDHVDESDDPEVAFETADTYRRISQIRADLYQYADAVNGLIKANQILNGLREQFPENAKYETSLAENLFSLGLHLQRLQKTRESAEHFLTSADLYHSCWSSTNSDDFQVQRARALINASMRYYRLGNSERAIELNDQADNLLQTHGNESSLFWLRNYALVLENKAAFLGNRCLSAEQITFYEKAIQLLEQANELPDVDAGLSDYIARIHLKLARAHYVRRSEPRIWSQYTKRASDLYESRWKSRPDRPAMGKEYAKVCSVGAKWSWFSGDTETAQQWYRREIDTLKDIKTRFPGFAHTLSPDNDEVAYWLTLLWAICPVEELRDHQAALELSRNVLEERPASLWARIAFTIAEGFYGDIEIAAGMLESEPFFQKGSPIIGRLLALLVQHRRGEMDISEADMVFLRNTRDDRLNYGGIAQEISERIIQIVEDN